MTLAAWKIHLACAVLLVLTSLAALADSRVEGRAKSDDVDPLALAAVLLQGGDHERALAVLATVEVKPTTTATDTGPDLARFHTLRGLARLHLHHVEEAEADLAEAFRLRPAPRLALSLAQASSAAGHPDRALAALAKTGDLARTEPAVYALRAEAALERRQQIADQVGDHGERLLAVALSSLRSAYAQYGDVRFAAREIEVLVDADLLVEASAQTQRLMHLARSSPSEAFEAHSSADRDRSTPFASPDLKRVILGLMEMIRRAENTSGQSQVTHASGLAEEAALLWPRDPDVALFRARAYADAGPFRAASLYEAIAVERPEFAVDAAELYRRAGRSTSALLVNARAPPSARKSQQRFGLLLEQGRLEEATAMLPELHRYALLNDDTIRFALGWALFETGRYTQAETTLVPIRDVRLFADAASLRQRIAACVVERTDVAIGKPGAEVSAARSGACK